MSEHTGPASTGSVKVPASADPARQRLHASRLYASRFADTHHLSRRVLRYRRALIIAMHALLLAAAFVLAFQLRFDFQIPPEEWRRIGRTLPLVLAIRLTVLGLFRLDRGFWRHFSLADLTNLVKAVTLSTMVWGALAYGTPFFSGFPRSVLAIDWLLAIFLTGGVRFAVRFSREHGMSGRRQLGKRTLVIGAGESAEWLLRHLHTEGQTRLRVVGLVDDDPNTWGLLLHGVPVLGSIEDLRTIVATHRVELLVIAITSASGAQMRRIVERCVDARVDLKILPSLPELLAGRVGRGEMRRVEVEDLLGRDPIHTDLDQIERDLADSVVLVTGGAGSIGSELARQIARFRPKLLVLYEMAESPLYYTQLELAQAYPELNIAAVIGSVADEERLAAVFSRYRPDYVLHAAAYKHVPMMEANVTEAVRNNVFGTLRLAQCAARHGVRKFVLISTDKAVNPSSVMGATKRIAERIVLGLPSLRASKTDFRAVRFGNVLGSDGSVLPLFKRQLAAGGPLTVTHPEATRYFMTIPEAAQLVLQAAALPEMAGRIAMLEMGEQVRVLDLAENLIRLSGFEPYQDVQIVFTGIRPGEKLHEELTSSVEACMPSSVSKIHIVQTDEAEGAAIERGLSRLGAAVLLGSQSDLVLELCALVPECVSPLRDLERRAQGVKYVELQGA
jgi:FlaA1/EpsC-like NDP-sugar epimerase